MLKFLSALLILFIQDAPINISSPQAGDTLRGKVEIIGKMDLPDFSSAELAFKYAPSSAENWFVIQTFSQPEAGPAISIWDTTLLTDGDYTLRLRVLLQDDTFQDASVSDLKIRNDAALPTETPFPQFSVTQQSEVLTAIPTTAILTYPSSTPFPANPASVTSSSIYWTFARGALVVLVVFIIFSLLLRIRKDT